MKYKWNKPYQLVMKIKNDYIATFGELNTYDINIWIQKLNKEEYNDFIEPLQINQENEFILIRYGLAEMQKGMWEDKNSIYRQCRSVVIDLKREELVLTPFRKFFNLNEVEENKIENIVEEIKNARYVEITDKLDGSMQSVRYYNNDYFMTGSMALNKNNSWRLQDGYNMLTDNHKEMIRDNEESTFIFEYISLKDSHVVNYTEEDEGLYLIGMIDIYTGHEFSYETIKATSEAYGIKCANIENYTFDEILDLSKTIKSDKKEGWVLNIDGHKVKIKCDDYVKLHRILDKLSSINLIIQSIADNNYDDLISKVPDMYKPRVEKISNKIFNWLKESEKYIDKMYNKAPKDDKKSFMIYVDDNVEYKFKSYVRAKYLNQKYNLLKSNSGKYKQIKDILGENINYSVLFSKDGDNNA